MASRGESETLNDRQRLFVAEYCRCLNGTQAAIAAGYSAKTARQMGTQNLSLTAVKEAIKTKLAERRLASEEIIARIEQHATASMGDFISLKEREFTIGRGKAAVKRTVKNFELDLEKAEKLGLLHLVREFKTDPKTGSVTVKLYDAQRALIQLGRAHHALGNEQNNRDDDDENDDITDDDIADELVHA